MKLHKRTDIRHGSDWTVWRGEQAATRQLVLVKEVNRQSPYLPQLVARLRDEVQFLQRLNHAQFPKVLTLDPDGLRAIFSDAQCNLTRYTVAHGPLPPTLVANVLAMAADGLDHLHGRKFGHGAVNLHTLFVGPIGDVLFADFLGYEFGSSAPMPVPDPEPRYQAPELIDTTLGKPGPASDLYCLGFVALELLAGEKFEQLFGVADGANWLAWHADPYKQLVDWQPALSHAPAGLLEVIAGLIAKRPGERQYTTAAQLKAALIRGRLTSDARLPPYRPGARHGQGGGTATMPRPPVRTRTGKLPSRPPRRPTLHLHPTDDIGAPRTFTPETPALVGRARGCNVICDGAAVSPKHAVIICGPDGVWRIYDLMTPAGVFVNGVKLSKSRLYPDDELSIGGCGLRVELDYKKPGKAFDQFRLEATLHSGRRGKVYRASWLTRMGRAVAVRVFPKDFQSDSVGLRRFLRGVPEAAQLRSRHLVKVYRGGTEQVAGDRVWFLAMEYLPGGSLRDRLRRRGRLPVAEGLRATREMAVGAAAVAASGLVHRNINPGCVLFAADGRAKLGDFFFARPVEPEGGYEVSRSGDGAANGIDPVYQAPECLVGERKLTPACDVYSIGATLYEAVTGRPPYDPALPLSELRAKAQAGQFAAPHELNPAVPRTVTDIVVKAMAADPSDRYADPSELARALGMAEAGM